MDTIIDRLGPVSPMRTDLPARMSQHRPGQVTWPEPLLGRSCAQCAHLTPEKPRKDGTLRGRCAKVMTHQNVQGVAFSFADAVACPQFYAAGPAR
ncbi:hypothetical protein [Pararhodobacter zhoushanensis]|uniref:hypothetical protein n=1 Tax=Pararhodobacter zhoushanensis TaxID=2479545 RepID=UPI000F8D7E92|nr:hypothetical protein [Pararhodobacter zhoushanensis]